MPETQTLKNHRRLVPAYHIGVLLSLLVYIAYAAYKFALAPWFGTGVTLLLNDSAESFTKTNDGLSVELKSGKSLPAQLVVIGIGVRPESTLAANAGLEIGPRGGIRTEACARASLGPTARRQRAVLPGRLRGRSAGAAQGAGRTGGACAALSRRGSATPRL